MLERDSHLRAAAQARLGPVIRRSDIEPELFSKRPLENEVKRREILH
jgi:hypothetical protein